MYTLYLKYFPRQPLFPAPQPVETQRKIATPQADHPKDSAPQHSKALDAQRDNEKPASAALAAQMNNRFPEDLELSVVTPPPEITASAFKSLEFLNVQAMLT